MLHDLLDLFLHLDRHLQEVVATYGGWTYLILFLIVFCETGLVVTPILPGDSLLFAVGAFAALGVLDLWLSFVLLIVAAILGDTVNYWIGRKLAPRIVSGQKVRFIRQEHLDRTHAFFERYGGKTIILARFVPIVRTFAPFVAGAGAMTYGRFMTYNVVGGIAWVAICLFAGYFFGNLPWVRDNFSLVALGIVGVSMLPAVVEYLRHRREKKQAAATTARQ